MSMIQKAAGSNNGALISRLDTIIALLTEFFEKILPLMEKDIVLDDGTLVGKLLSLIDQGLGNESRLKERGI